MKIRRQPKNTVFKNSISTEKKQNKKIKITERKIYFKL